MKFVTCVDNTNRENELTVGEQYRVISSDSIACLVFLSGHEEPFTWTRFAEYQ